MRGGDGGIHLTPGEGDTQGVARAQSLAVAREAAVAAPHESEAAGQGVAGVGNGEAGGEAVNGGASAQHASLGGGVQLLLQSGEAGGGEAQALSRAPGAQADGEQAEPMATRESMLGLP